MIRQKAAARKPLYGPRIRRIIHKRNQRLPWVLVQIGLSER